MLSESRTEHLTSGFSGAIRDREANQVLGRLSRELAALGLSADVAFQTLANKRGIMLSRIYEVVSCLRWPRCLSWAYQAYDGEFRKAKMQTAKQRQFDASPFAFTAFDRTWSCSEKQVAPNGRARCFQRRAYSARDAGERGA